MERRPAARCRARGGEGIPAARADRTRLGAGAAAVAVAAGTGGWLWAVAEDSYLAQATLVATASASALLVGALALRRPFAIPVALVLLAAPYVAVLAFEVDSLDARAPVVAALLFAIAELAYWSLEARGAVADEPGTHLRRLSVLATLAVATVFGGTALLALVGAVAARGAAIDVAGAAAAVTAVALLVVVASRRGVR